MFSHLKVHFSYPSLTRNADNIVERERRVHDPHFRGLPLPLAAAVRQHGEWKPLEMGMRKDPSSDIALMSKRPLAMEIEDPK